MQCIKDGYIGGLFRAWRTEAQVFMIKKILLVTVEIGMEFSIFVHFDPIFFFF